MTPSSPPRRRVPAPSRKEDTRSWPVKRALSAGGVVVRPAGDDWEVALTLRRTLQGNPAWGLPKGGLEDGEDLSTAALREVLEETGLVAEILADLQSVTYFFPWAPDRTRYRKTVHFFLMRMTGGDPADHDDESEEVRFFPIGSAPRKASYSSERKVLRRAAEIITAW